MEKTKPHSSDFVLWTRPSLNHFTVDSSGQNKPVILSQIRSSKRTGFLLLDSPLSGTWEGTGELPSEGMAQWPKHLSWGLDSPRICHPCRPVLLWQWALGNSGATSRPDGCIGSLEKKTLVKPCSLVWLAHVLRWEIVVLLSQIGQELK